MTQFEKLVLMLLACILRNVASVQGGALDAAERETLNAVERTLSAQR
jgi:hypothetical protein